LGFYRGEELHDNVEKPIGKYDVICNGKDPQRGMTMFKQLQRDCQNIPQNTKRAKQEPKGPEAIVRMDVAPEFGVSLLFVRMFQPHQC
jgi:hypothetical protein